MSRLGQCPSCRVVYELDDDAVGQVIDCQCGAALFACDVAGFTEIPVFCTACDGEYVVDSDGAGEVVQCECGAQITVPTAVLRLPVATPDATTTALLARQDQPAKGDEHIISCPSCGNQYCTTSEDLGDEAVCKCGCVFLVGAGPDGAVVAKEKRPGGKKAEDDGEHEDKPLRRKKPVSMLSIAGVAAVALLLMISIIMFVTRDSGKVASSDSGQANESPPRPESAATTIPEGTTIKSSPLIANAAPDSIRPIPGPQPAVASTAGGKNRPSSAEQQQAFLAPPPPTPLPQAKPPRKVVPIIPAGNRGLTFDRAYAEAFAAYEETNRLKKQAETSGNTQKYHEQLGTAIGLLQQTLELATRQGGNDKVNELRYLLTYLYFTAGRLPEASVLGEAVARWGDAKDKSTREAAMISLAAAQEANESAWGIPAAVGELGQMGAVANVIAKRWPQDPQLDLIWMNLGQRYDAFGKPLSAAAAFARVAKSSPHYGSAQLAAGSALWAQYRITAAHQAGANTGDQADVLKRAETLLSNGVDVLVSQNKPTTAIMSAKLTLARMAMLAGDLQTAESRLVNEPMSVTESISISKSTETTTKVTEPFLRAVFETLFAIRTQQRDPAGAKAALEMMAAKLGPGADANVGKMFLSVATDYIDQLVSSPTVTREQFSTLSELIQPLKEHDSTLTVPNVLWLGESWSRLAERASTPELAKQCYAKAAAAYEIAMSRPDFPAASGQSATLRRAQLLRNSGDTAAAIPLLESILKETPNAFALQIEAAEALQQAAIDSGQANQLLAALNGPTDPQGTTSDSPIWGWSKLVTTLHAARSGDEDKDRQRVLKCQYNMYLCQLLIAQADPDAERREELLSDLIRSLSRVVSTTSPDREPWHGKFQELLLQASGD